MDVNLVKPIVEEVQKRIFFRVVITFEEASVFAFELVLRFSFSLADNRLRSTYRKPQSHPFCIALLSDRVLIADHQIELASLFLNAAGDVFCVSVCHINLPPY